VIKLTFLWTLCLFLLPLLLVQGLYARRTTMRLSEAPGLGESQVRVDAHIIGLGDSVIAGVGIDEIAHALTAQVAVSVSEKSGRSVSWSSHGVNGDRVRDLIARIKLLPIERPSLLLISIGVNDVSHFTSLTVWQLEISNLIADLKDKYKAPILFIGLPPMDQFPALPQPLRFALGVRAAMLDHTLKRAGELIRDVHWYQTSMKPNNLAFAKDGYHPSAKACSILSMEIATFLAGKIFIENSEGLK
jgi:lysophospholipase L1-like esterase